MATATATAGYGHGHGHGHGQGDGDGGGDSKWPRRQRRLWLGPWLRRWCRCRVEVWGGRVEWRVRWRVRWRGEGEG